MATRTQLRTRVANRTGRGGEANFASICNEAFYAFLLESASLHSFRESLTTDSGAFTSGLQRLAFPTSAVTGFASALHHIVSVSAGLTDESGLSFPLEMRAIQWLDSQFPDRKRTGTTAAVPQFCARLAGYLELQAPTNAAYTVKIVSSHLPADFASDGASNPIALLDNALVAYASFEILTAAELWQQAQVKLQQANYYRDIAILADKKDPALVHRADGTRPMYDPSYRFNLSQLQTVYPGDTL